VRAPSFGQVGLAALATVEREVVVHDSQRHGAAARQIDRVVNRMPEAPQVPACRRRRPRESKIKASRSPDAWNFNVLRNLRHIWVSDG
jgi:hypothetical protein